MPKALSLKYRPKTFSDLIGQDSVSQTLSLALELDKVSHAYLFSGLRGSGKTSSARIFAKALQCEKSPTATPCNECASCVAVNEGSHLDIIEMDAASSRGIDDIKNLIEQIQYPPSFGRFKVFIIDEIHMLTKEAFNAFLKTLEEPPNYVKFILATTDPLKLPVTILSRTQHFRFKKIPQNSIATHLKNILALENITFESEAIDLLSRNCGGSLRDAMTSLEQAIIFSKENITLQSVSSMLGSLNPSKIDEFFKAIMLKDDSKLDALLVEFEAYEADNVIDEMIDFLKNKMLEKNSDYALVILERFFKILGEAKNMLNINADSSFVLLLSLLKMKESLKIQEIDKMIAKLRNEIDSENLQDFTTQNASFSQDSNKADSTKPNFPQENVKKTSEIPPQGTPSEKFKKVVEKIYERDYELGEIFSKNIAFVSFENNILTWESSAKNEAKDKLRMYYKIILEITKEVFGNSIEICNKKSSGDSAMQKNSDSSEVKSDSKNDSDSALNSSVEIKGNIKQNNGDSVEFIKSDSAIEMIKGIFPVEKVEVCK